MVGERLCPQGPEGSWHSGSKDGWNPPFGFFAKGSAEQFSQSTAAKALDGCARKSKAQNLAILVYAGAKSAQTLEGGIDRLDAAARREYAARSASDQPPRNKQ